MRTRNSEQEDYLLRVIEQIGRAMARLREMLTGSTSSAAAIRSEVSTNVRLLLGSDAGMLEQLDPASAARLIGSAKRITVWAELLELEAEAWTRDGDPARAAIVSARAVALKAASTSYA